MGSLAKRRGTLKLWLNSVRVGGKDKGSFYRFSLLPSPAQKLLSSSLSISDYHFSILEILRSSDTLGKRKPGFWFMGNFYLKEIDHTRLKTTHNMNAYKPYDVTALADVILRSSNHVDFYVLSAFLRYVSPTFRAMFSLNGSQSVEQNEKKDEHPVVPLAEDSQTIRLLLDSIYPTSQEPDVGEVGLFWKGCKATQKYCMDVVEDKLRKRILASDVLPSQPLRVYAVATDLGWDDVAIAAARLTLNIPLESLSYVDELQSITGAGFFRFLEYRLRCNKSSSTALELLKALPGPVQCSQPNTITDRTPVNNLAPFDQPSTTADLIIRSTDMISFFVSSPLIRMVSPVLNTMVPSQDHEVNDGKLIVSLPERSEVLHQLLRIIHHDLDEPDIKQCQTYINLVLAARKYKMAAIERRLHKQATNSPLVSTDPLRIYIVATALGWKELAKSAALNTLYQPLESVPHLDEFRLISGGDLYRLVQFRFRCADAACNALQTNPRFMKFGFGHWNTYLTSGTVSTTTRNEKHEPLRTIGTEKRAHKPSLTFHFTLPTPAPPAPPVPDAYAQLRACPRGSTITGVYSQSFLLQKSGSGKFEMSPDVFFNILQCVQDAGKIVETAISDINLLSGSGPTPSLGTALG